MLPTGTATVLKASNRFKKAGAARRAREADERAERVAQLEKQLEEKGGIGALLLDSRENKMQMEKLQEQMEAMQLLMKTQFEQLNTQLQKIA